MGDSQTKEELEESLRKAGERHEAFEREKSQRGAGEVEHVGPLLLLLLCEVSSHLWWYLRWFHGPASD